MRIKVMPESYPESNNQMDIWVNPDSIILVKYVTIYDCSRPIRKIMKSKTLLGAEKFENISDGYETMKVYAIFLPNDKIFYSFDKPKCKATQE
jgi:hypothetical protein